MVKLTAIKKTYTVGDNKVQALKGIDLQFRKGEFVSILGPSGCGKTTMLNIIGGLDRYDSGDIEVNGISTKAFKASDWDAYRNHSVGFVFQSYNLIGHQTVLSNVELALTLAGVSKAERRRRAKQALVQVGLESEMKKKPNQLSGGQMQRVAIARALINNPEIILADEPTGALDSETSKQVMEILAEVAKERLVIMVTHNGELAEEYSTRIIKLFDGEVVSDSMPCNLAEYSTGVKTQEKKPKKKSMSLKTAFTLSLNNLFTKKGRTILTSFAGSIGIIGIALILSMSSGFQGYINRVQEETLSTYPLTIMATTTTNGMSVMFTGGEEEENFKPQPDTVYSSTMLANLYNSIQNDIHFNDLRGLKAYIENEKIPYPDAIQKELEGTNAKTSYTMGHCKIKDVSTVQYNYGLTLNFYCSDTSNGVVKADTVEVIDTIYKEVMGMSYTEMLNSMSGMLGGAVGNFASSVSMDMWCELIDNQELLESQYEMLGDGHWPAKPNQVVLCVSENNKINEFVEFGMNLRTREELNEMLAQIKAPENNGKVEYERKEYTFDQLLNTTFKLVLNCDKYQEGNGKWYDNSTNPAYLKSLVDNGLEIEIVGIIRPREDSVAQSMTGVLGYRHDLVEYIIEQTNESPVVKAQEANPNINILTGKPFNSTDKEDNKGEIPAEFIEFANKLDAETQAEFYALLETQDSAKWIAFMGKLSDELKAEFLSITAGMSGNKENSEATYESNLELFGSVDFDCPKSISLYPVDFEAKDIIKEEVNRFNNDRRVRFSAFINDQNAEGDGKDNGSNTSETKYDIIYSDLLATMLSSVSTIINAISYVLIAFVSISLVVSSIMIGVITYISVLERTKEIGILRAMGASKRDIARVFNAETLIVGFVAGALGIGVTVLLNIPVNMIINSIAEIGNISKLPLMGGVILVAISMFLTFVAGLIPSRIAAKKDPVVALRTE